MRSIRATHVIGLLADVALLRGGEYIDAHKGIARMRSRSATCACGKLSLDVSGDPRLVAICGCHQCQQRTGSAYGVHAFFPQNAVAVSGKHKKFSRTSHRGRMEEFHFCPSCGSTMFWKTEDRPDVWAIALGAFAGSRMPAPTIAQWTSKQPGWVPLPPVKHSFAKDAPAAELEAMSETGGSDHRSDGEDRPPSPVRTQEERRAETSNRLINATIDLLLEKGYSRLRVTDAAARAGVSRGGQTHHFATKNDLIETAIERVFQGEVSLAQTEASTAAPADIVSSSAHRVEEFLSSKLYRVSLNMLISAGRSNPFADRVRAISARNRSAMEEAWIDRLANATGDRDQAEVALSMLWSVQRGVAVDRAIEGRTNGGRDVVDATITMVKDWLQSDRKAA